ncbi:MAG: transcriptional regulator [Candidatus Bipolaricaulota bacterium]|nr:transcriptional regulator [Candidatus Bipolaricaulota bacterium]
MAIYHAPETRRKVLELLKLHGPMTAQRLAEELGITVMGVRGQLAALERDGIIRHEIVPQKLGRPSYLYSLTELGDELFPRTYAQFAQSLLEAIQAVEGPKALERLFDHRTELLAAQYRARMNGRSLRERVAELARIRTEEGYMADWEELGKNRFLLTEHNCAICQIAQRCPTACSHELELFRRVLDDATVTRDKHIIKGDSMCTYVIRPKR